MAGIKGAPQLNPYKFKPGQSGNPKGKPRNIFTKDEADKVFQKSATMSEDQLREIVDNPKSRAVDVAVARAWLKAMEEGRIPDIDQLLNRTVGKVKEQVEQTNHNHEHKEILEGVPSQTLIALVKKAENE